MKSRTLIRLAEKLRQKHAELNSWPQASIACGVLTKAGKSNPRLAQMIAAGYDPRKPETRSRLGLPPRCTACSRRLPGWQRSLPAWLLEAVQNLVYLEKKTSHPAQARVYARDGKRVKIPVRETSICDRRRIKHDTIATIATIPSPRRSSSKI